MSEDSFQLPKSTYDEVRNVIVAYGHLGKPGNLQDVSQHGGGSTSTISRNNGFLVSLGLVESGKKKGPTELGLQLANALEHDQNLPDEVSRLWKKVVQQSDFLQKVLTAVRVRKGMELSALESHIAYTAGEKRTSRVMTGAKTVIDILLVANLIRESNGKLIAIQNDEDQSPVSQNSRVEEENRTSSPFSPPSLFDPPALDKTDTQVIQHKTKITSHQGKLNIDVKIDVKVDCSIDELAELGEGLRSLLDMLREDYSETASE